MSRLPFDPSKIARQDVGKPAERERARGAGDASGALSVTQLTLLVKDALSAHTPSSIQLVGELGDFNDRGHWYLTLKDESNKIDCVMWPSAAAKVTFQPERGMQLLATGKLDFYGPQGRIQLYLDKLEPVGLGALELRFKQLCEELRAAGYFQDVHKQRMPAFPQHLAVITSAKGAALQDVINTARHRWPGIRITVVDVRVQGAEAAGQVARAIEAVDRQHVDRRIDTVILTRGGGSLEDLWAFNEKVVAEAIHRAAVPIAAAIGHEVDTTIAELVADLRCSTPTQAAERLVPDVRAERQRIDHHAHRLLRVLVRHAERGRQRVDAAARHELFRRPRALAERASEQVGELSRHLTATITRRHAAAAQTLVAAERQLHAVSPRNVLARGYSYTTDAAGNVLRAAEQVRPGDRIHTHLAEGEIDSVVDGEAPAKPKPRPRKGLTKRKPKGPPDQPKLFG